MKHDPQIVCWHPVLTPHQAYTVQALAKAGGIRLTVVVAAMEHSVRKRQGWTTVHPEGVDIVALEGPFTLFHIFRLAISLRKHTHIFGSPFEDYRLTLAAIILRHLRGKIFLISEPYSLKSHGYFDDGKVLNWLKSRLRPAIYRLYSKLLIQGVCGVFAISKLAVKQYASLGVSPDRIFPFGYFVPKMSDSRRDLKCKAPIRLVFVGSLIALKGLDYLIEAIQSINRPNKPKVYLDVYGPGDPSRFDIDGSAVNYRGVAPFGGAGEIMAKYHALILPSKYDGWGVVVNEALQNGVPVLCSTAVGSSCIVEKWQCGTVFEPNLPSLITTIQDILRNPQKLDKWADACSPAAASLSPDVAGMYMWESLKFASNDAGRPQAPWY